MVIPATPDVHRAPILLVDGHSLIYSTGALAALQRNRPAAARVELVRRLAAFQDRTDVRVVIVFDGAGSRTETAGEEYLPGAPQIIYSAMGCTADAVIERLVVKYAEHFQLTVATRDRAEADMVSGSGAIVVSPEGLWDWIASTEARFQSGYKQWLRRD